MKKEYLKRKIDDLAGYGKILSKARSFKRVVLACFSLLLLITSCDPDPAPVSNLGNGTGSNQGTAKTVSLVAGVAVGISDKYNNTIGHITYSNTNKGSGSFLYATTQSGYYLNVSICDMGVVSGLAAMKEVPLTGFTNPASVNSVNCIPQHGYIFKFINYNYGEECIVFLHVEKYITSDNNEIIGCEIKYRVRDKDTFYF